MTDAGQPYTLQIEDDEKARLNAIYSEYQDSASSATPPSSESHRPSRSSSIAKRPTPAAVAEAAEALRVNTNPQNLEDGLSDDAEPKDSFSQPPPPLQSLRTDQDGIVGSSDAARLQLEMERQRESKRKAALFELVDTERTYTDDLRMVVELFLLPIQLLGNRKIVDVIFGDMVKITEMNGKMYLDMITRLGPLACLVDPKRASRNRRKKKNALKPTVSSHISSHPRSVLQGSSIRSPTTPVLVSASASSTMSRRLSNPNEPSYSSPRASVHSSGEPGSVHDAASLNRVGSRNEDHRSMLSNGDDMSIRTSASGGSSGD
ncbi:hypothetical protein H4R20_005385, partial [Coemansia guatemalensis]